MPIARYVKDKRLFGDIKLLQCDFKIEEAYEKELELKSIKRERHFWNRDSDKFRRQVLEGLHGHEILGKGSMGSVK